MEWISVKDRLPDEDDNVGILIFFNGMIKLANYSNCGFTWEPRFNEDDSDKVTHWMPLPEAPKE